MKKIPEGVMAGCIALVGLCILLALGLYGLYNLIKLLF